MFNQIKSYVQSNILLQEKYARKIWKLVLIIFLSIQVISCLVIIQSPSWWIKSINFQNIPIANIINSSEKPLILSPMDSWSHLISISHNLNNHVTIRFIDHPYLRETDTIFSDKFIFNSPEEWLDSINKENKFKVEKIYKGNAALNFSLVRIL